MKATVTIRNHIDKEKLVKNFDDELIDEIREKIVRRARQLVPVDTGKLKGSIRKIQKFTVGSTVRYAGFVEYGTRFMTARPYMEPAIDDVMRTLPAMEKKAFREAARRSRA